MHQIIIRKVTANDITRIDLVRDKALGHSSKIQIPIGGNEIYKVTISELGKIPPHRHHQADAPRGKICVRFSSPGNCSCSGGSRKVYGDVFRHTA